MLRIYASHPHPHCLQDANKVALWDKKERPRIAHTSYIAKWKTLQPAIVTFTKIAFNFAPFPVSFTDNADILSFY